MRQSNYPAIEFALTIFVLLGIGACQPTISPEAVADDVSATRLASHIEVLASDEFEGRAPASPGEEKTIHYLQQEFRRLGLKPGNGESYLQQVPLVEITADSTPALKVEGGSQLQEFAYLDEIMVWTKRVVEAAELDRSELVFVGYGVVAPEYGWDDYSDVDVKGKTVVMLVNDPGFATQDPELFNGRSMTYYGRWTYKYQEAARQGAVGALIVHETEPAAYPWEVVTGSWSGPQFGLESRDSAGPLSAIEGWITLATAEELFSQAGLDFAEVKTQALEENFRARELGLRASLTLRNKIRRSISNNVLGLIRGSQRPDEYVCYMAHWDHLGRDPNLDGDQIYNGALDNASGTAGLLELARAFAQLDPAPARSLLFLAVTAEEQGLLGSAYYSDNPVFPTRHTVAAINLDGMNLLGRTRDITVVGYGFSELDDYLSRAAASQDRQVVPDPEPEKGYYYRSDHFNFARKGVPALYADSGIDYVEQGSQWGREQRDDYTANRYHKPSDEFRSDWDLSGLVEDLKLFFQVGHELATIDDFPNWRTGNEFRAIRDRDRSSGS